jgi:hypothetical protein
MSFGAITVSVLKKEESTMKKALFVFGVLAVATSAMAVPSLVAIAPFGTGTSTDARAITPDGKYVVGTGVGNTYNGFIWDATNGTRGDMVAGSYMNAIYGVAYRTNPTTSAQELMIAGKQSSGQVGVFLTTDAGTTWSRPFSTNGSAPATGSCNALGSGSPTADYGWLGWAEGTSSYSVTRVYGDPIANGTATKSSSTKITIGGVSNTGRAAASRRDAAGVPQNVWLGFTSDGGTASQNYFNGLAGNTYGTASAMSGDGTKVFGQSPTTTDATNKYPYVYDIASATITALPLLPGTTGSTSLGFIYGASADGRYAVGMDYVGKEKAALWDLQTGAVIDLTAWATANGMLGVFDGNLRRAYSVGVNSEGQPVICGMGYSNTLGTRGFVLTLPEPTTMLFLAVGGFALLRRR